MVSLDSMTGARAVLRLYGTVRDVRGLRAREGLSCVLLDPRRVLHPLQVAVAANRAVLARTTGTMISRTLHTEIVYNMSLSKNISRSLAQFGADTDGDVLVCCVIDRDHEDRSQEAWTLLESAGAGELRPLCHLRTLTDIPGVRTLYHLPQTDQLQDDHQLLSIILSRMVTKNFVSH